MAQLSQDEKTILKLIPEVNAHHREALKAARDSIKHALEAGRILTQLKAACQHGQFETLIETKCDFTPRTARRYMQILSKWDAIKESVGDKEAYALSINGGLQALCSIAKAEKEPKRIPLDQDAEPVEDHIPEPPQFTIASPEAELITGDCPRGGDHEWVQDDFLDQVVCEKCSEPQPQGDSQNRTYIPGRPGDEPTIPPPPPKPTTDRKAFLIAEDLFGELIRMIEACYQHHPHDQHRSDVVACVDMAYKAFTAWKKEASK